MENIDHIKNEAKAFYDDMFDTLDKNKVKHDMNIQRGAKGEHYA